MTPVAVSYQIHVSSCWQCLRSQYLLFYSTFFCQILGFSYIFSIISGIVKAAMKKKLSYNFKLKLNVRGEVVNSSCECPAGKGPHGCCKHVAAVLIMLQEFKETGNLEMVLSCTEILQAFHQPLTRHTGMLLNYFSCYCPCFIVIDKWLCESKVFIM